MQRCGARVTVHLTAAVLVVLLVWVYYSAQILFLGAEFTHVYTKWREKRVEPEPIAVPITPEARAQQGIPHKHEVAAAQAMSAAQGR